MISSYITCEVDEGMSKILLNIVSEERWRTGSLRQDAVKSDIR